MIAEAGLAALWLAAAFALVQLMLAWGAARVSIAVRPEPVEGREAAGETLAESGASTSSARTELSSAQLMTALRRTALVQGLLALLSFGLLIALFVRSDMSVVLVAENSHSLKPMIYKVAGAWGNHEGSMLLWVTVLAVAGAGVAALERRLAGGTLAATLGAQAAIALGFYAFLAFASNPFVRLNPPAPDGQGLNPLLQDPGLAFHPPTLYLGYVGLSVAFSFAVGALVMRDVGPAFAKAMRPWVLVAWIFLTIGITAGSYWAYYELGWGGWWFWDPVENASLMPWLAATALLHSVTVLATRDGLRAWTLMLALVAFAMSMIGTFLVRSGILVSVHAFAVDPTRGTFILALLGIYIGGALALFGARVGTITQGSTFQLVSREGALVLNNLLLSVILGVVFIGTLYPLAAQAAGVQLSIGAPFFNKALVPVALALVAATSAGPLLRWRRDNLNALAKRVLVPTAAAGAAFALIFALSGGAHFVPVLGIAFAVGLGVASVVPVVRRNLRRTPLHVWGMVIAHLGVAVSIAGMAADTAFKTERLAAIAVGQNVTVGPFRVTLADVHPTVGPNWSALEARLQVRRGDGPMFELFPQQRFFSTPPTNTNEAAITTMLDGQLYTVLGQGDEQGRWQIRLWWKPFVTLIWLGGALIALGGALALIGRVRRERRVDAESWA
ncbi:heme lyase CcmF/NrfE family subunit [Sphingomonas sp. Root241]|uniref:heme lyase CcmF/NrfE family subunit n=1 Tax=Sphingomonas sp. Root241 TaxID=1736501 RepID=UPI0006FD1FC4|nr:heme lyase CcmF/NrfE family subunit [Sphingomonas sp. Root241]KRC82499.1 cytochrome C biogenesis protein CcmF [Sphingomonas sp. Root241]